MKNHPWRIGAVHWLRFSLVGAIGLGVQLGTLALLTTVFRVEYMFATVVAVELSVLHNFVCHERFTWAERRSGRWADACVRALHFNVTIGAVSIGGNLLLMRLLVGELHLPVLFANLMSIVGCSLVNFLVSDRWVFRARLDPAVGTTGHI